MPNYALFPTYFLENNERDYMSMLAQYCLVKCVTLTYEGIGGCSTSLIKKHPFSSKRPFSKLLKDFLYQHHGSLHNPVILYSNCPI